MFRQLMAALAFSLGLLLMWSCNLAPDQRTKVTELVADSTWMEFERLVACQINDSGRVIDTLYDGAVPSPERLNHFNLADYPGVSYVLIRGYLDGTLVFEQKRNNDRYTHDYILATRIWVLSIKAQPETMVLFLGGEASVASAVVRPLVATANVKWTLAANDVVSLDISSDSLASSVKIKPLKVGETVLTLKHPLDSTKTDSIKVRVVPAPVNSVTLTPDSLRLFVGGTAASLTVTVAPKEADSSLQWSSSDSTIATVDSKGTVTPIRAGNALIIAASTVSSKADTASVHVVLDAPLVNVTLRKLAPAENEVEFQVKASQEFGTLESFKWDLNGDGIWDDSLIGPWSGTEKSFAALKATYLKSGEVIARFSVRDGEGNITQTQVTVSIGNQAPRILAIRRDTVVSIKDSIPFFSTVTDTDGSVAQVAWDFDGDGVFEDSLANGGPSLTSTFAHAYAQAGRYKAVLRVKDNWGKATEDTVTVTVLLDAPVADIGADTTVMAGTGINILIKGTDKFGPIVKRELKVGNGPFVPLSKQDTSILAPLQAGELLCVGRVTDDDGLTGTDSMVVTVTAIPKPKYRITGHAGSGGTITPDSVLVDSGSKVVISIIPDSAYRVDSLFVNGALVSVKSVGRGVTLLHTINPVDKAYTLRATFLRYFSVKANSSLGGNLTVDSNYVDSAGTRSFLSSPSPTFILASLVNGPTNLYGQVPGELNKPATLKLSKISSDLNLVGNFALAVNVTIQCDSGSRMGGGQTAPPSYNLSYNGRDEGSDYFVDPSPRVLPMGAVVTLVAADTWAQCAHCVALPFKFWDKDGVTVGATPTYTFTVDKARTLTGVYIKWP